MQNLSLKEKYYVTLAHPDLELEDVSLGLCFCSGRRKDAKPNTYFTEKSFEAYSASKSIEGFSICFKFRDLGPAFRMKEVRAPKQIVFFKLDETLSEVIEEHRFKLYSDEPEYLIADKDGSFTAELWFMTGERDSNIGIPPLDPGMRFVIKNMKIANQFVTESFIIAGIIRKPESQSPVYSDIRGVKYDLKCEGEERDWFDDIVPFLDFQRDENEYLKLV